MLIFFLNVIIGWIDKSLQIDVILKYIQNYSLKVMTKFLSIYISYLEFTRLFTNVNLQIFVCITFVLAIIKEIENVVFWGATISQRIPCLYFKNGWWWVRTFLGYSWISRGQNRKIVFSARGSFNQLFVKILTYVYLVQKSILFQKCQQIGKMIDFGRLSSRSTN